MLEISDLKLICRTCLKEEIIMDELFSNYDDSIQFADMLQFLIDDKNPMDDAYIEKICESCKEKLIGSYLFKRQCVESHGLLREYHERSKETVVVVPDVHLDEVEELQDEPENEFDNVETEFIIEKIDSESDKEIVTEEKRLISNCRQCNLEFKTVKEYQKHHCKYHKVKTVCQVCGKVLSRSALEKHLKTHNQVKGYQCTECGKRFTQRDNLLKHQRIHTNDQRYTCEFCDKKFVHWNSRRCHIVTAHKTEKEYSCVMCNKRFKQKSNLVRHLRGHNGQLAHECSYCGKRFLTSTELKNHIVTHTKERNHICEFCEKAFGTKKTLLKHVKIHLGEKNYVCTVCNKAFSQAHVLRTHLKTHPNCPIPLPGTILSQKALRKLTENQLIVATK